MHSTEERKEAAESARIADELAAYCAAGFSLKSAEDVRRIDAAMTRIRRMTQRREVVKAIAARLDPKLDLARLDVMITVMHAPAAGTAEGGEITVGAVADHLGIDPSRASRLVADVIELGYIRRAASQADSRRIVLEPTKKGLAFGEKFRRLKSAWLATSLKSWSAADLAEFARLVDRFTQMEAPGWREIGADESTSGA